MAKIMYKVTCPFCGKESIIGLTHKQVKEYFEDGKLIQDVLPDPFYNSYERELVISGICKDCQRKIFK